LAAHSDESSSNRSELRPLATPETLQREIVALTGVVKERQEALDAKLTQLDELLSRHAAMLLQKEAGCKQATHAVPGRRDGRSSEVEPLKLVQAERDALRSEIQ